MAVPVQELALVAFCGSAEHKEFRFIKIGGWRKSDCANVGPCIVAVDLAKLSHFTCFLFHVF